MGVDPYQRRCLVDHLGLGVGHRLAGLEGAHDAEQAPQTVGLAAVALAGGHGGGDRLGEGFAETGMAQDRGGQLMGLGKGQSGHNGLLAVCPLQWPVTAVAA